MKKLFTLVVLAVITMGVKAQNYILCGGDDVVFTKGSESGVTMDTPDGKSKEQTTATATWAAYPGLTMYQIKSDKDYASAAYITYNDTEYRTIKPSNGAYQAITLPDGITISKIVFIGYSNDADKSTYIKEIGAIENGEYIKKYENDGNADCIEVYKGSVQKDDSKRDVLQVEPGVITIDGLSLSGTFYFKNGGKQPCYIIELYKGGESSISSTYVETTSNVPAYNAAGQRVSKDAKGLVIVGGKKYVNK